jgi:hypothetical protein
VTAAALLATLLVVGLAVGAALLRRARPGDRATPSVSVESRAALSRDAGVALLRAGGAAYLVGWGRDGVRLVARLDGTEDR